MSSRQVPQRTTPVKLTEAQRKAVAEAAPAFADRLRLGERGPKAVAFTAAELKALGEKVGAAVAKADSGTKRNSLRIALDAIGRAAEAPKGPGAIPTSERVYQFRITLLDVHPPVWRRIQVKDCTLDKLHEHIQTSMGWTNSHLHHFIFGGDRDRKLVGDPMLMAENFDDMDYGDSTTTKLSQVVPPDGQRFRFRYEYDFGDSWVHEVLFEGTLRAEPGRRYPLCVEGARACPPEDCGGPWGYGDFVEAVTDPDHEQHNELLEWVGGEFDPEAFDPAAATKEMHRGLPNWRNL
jgi:hypothetical protein